MTKSYSFTVNDSLMMLAIDTVAFFILYAYLDEVLPNEYGSRKSAFFFIGKNKSRNPDDK